MKRGSDDSKQNADAVEGEEAPRRRYASAIMRDRRLRILKHAQDLLQETGVEGFTIRELTRRADVAQRTLYNVFGSKEDIVASAIDEHFAGLMRDIPALAIADDLQQQLRRIEQVAKTTVTLRRYATAMVGVFFSPTVDRRIYDSLYRISHGTTGGWAARAERNKLIVKLSPVNRNRLNGFIVNQSYANVTDWAAGRIGDDEFVIRAQLNFLCCVRAYLRPRHRAEADALIAGLMQQGETDEPEQS